MLIEIDGSDASSDGLIFRGADNSAVRGLVINSFVAGGSTGSGIIIGSDNVSIQGNYVGVDPTGMISKGNSWAGFTHVVPTSGVNALIGGLDPEDRNIISGNGSSAGYPQTGYVIQGNYIGVGADGTTAIPNSVTNPAGAFSIDECSDVTVGGTATGATNVISGNKSYGLSPLSASNLSIQGNIIGLDYSGTISVPNESFGIVAAGNSTNILIGGSSSSARNIISGNLAGVLVAEGTTGLIEGNYIGLDINGVNPIPNNMAGLVLGNVSSVTIGSSSTSGRNVISGNGFANVIIGGTTGSSSSNKIIGNYIGTNAAGNIDSSITAQNGGGVLIYGSSSGNIVGGSSASDSNRIAGNRGFGVAVGATHISVIDATLTGSNNAILRNEIYGNIANPDLSITTNEGIDLLKADLESEELAPPYLPDTFYDTGLNPNTVGGNITGQGNDYINHAVISSASHSGQNVSVVFSLNAAGSPGGKYRVEFFANDAPDREGRYYLGYVDVENGSGISVSSLVAQDGLDMSGKYITATVTPFDESLPNNGFGGTSEFSESVLVNTISSQEANSGSLAGTGSNSTVIIYVAAIMSILAIGLLMKSRFIDK